MEDSIQTFLADLLAKANLVHLPDDFRERYVLKLRALLEERIGAMSLQHLPKEKQKEFEQLLEKVDLSEQEMADFLQQHVPDYPMKVQKVMHEFSEEFLQTTQQTAAKS